MITYNKELNLLIFHKLNNPDMGDRFDCLKDIKESFKKFIDVSVMEVIESINDIIHDEYGLPDTFKFTVKEEVGFSSDEIHKIIWGEVPGRISVRILSLPYMDSLGKLHFWGSSERVKVAVNKLVSSDDISYDVSKEVLSIVLSKRTVRIINTATGIRIEGYKGSKLPLAQLIDFIQFKEGRGLDIINTIRNPILQKSLLDVTGEPNIYAIASADNQTGLITNLMESDEFASGKIRDSFNEAVSIDRALGEVLSRQVLRYPAGTHVTPSVLEDLKRNKINCFYIKTVVPFPSKKISGGIGHGFEMATVVHIPQGTLVTSYLKGFLDEAYPELADYDVLPQDISCYGSMFSFVGKEATREVVDFLDSVGFEGVLLGDRQIPCYFETEIIGNYTFLENDGWVYCKDNVVTKDYVKDRLTSEDLLAMFSTLGYMILRNKNVFLDKDKDFLKNVEMCNELMTRALKKAIHQHMRSFKTSIRDYIRGSSTDKYYIFSQLTETFTSILVENGDIDSCDTVNFLAEISQATHICKRVSEAPESMRALAVPYYGRLCLFETPEGKQLGLVNNKAMGCRIRDGVMYAAVRRVEVLPDKRIKISDKIEDLSVRDEIPYRISDIMELTPDPHENGVYLNTRITAIVPNPETAGDRRIYAKVMASDLHYVYAHTDAFISATSSMMPFLCSNDAVRISFGGKLMKASLNLIDPDEPCVQTSMYREIFNSSDAYLLRAEKSGLVTAIESDSISVMYDGDIDETVHYVNEFKVTTDSVTLMRYKVCVGDRVHKGQILADSSFSKGGVYCPGKNELVAYMSSGYNYEDAYHISERASVDFTSIGSMQIKRNRENTQPPDRTDMFKYFKHKELITNIPRITMRGEKQLIPVYADHGSGIWYNLKSTVFEGKKVYIFSILGYNKLKTGDKMSGRHGNKGVDARVSPTSSMPMLPNGKPIRLFLSPVGVPSRMNLGQIDETHMGLCATVMGINMQSDAINGATLEELQDLMKLTHELANAPDSTYYASIVKKYNYPDDIVPVLVNNEQSIHSWANTFDENGDCRLWNPVTCEWFPNKITIGVSYILKLKQEAETKIHVRSGCLDETYRITTSQPPKGGEMGGQAYGEMELLSIMAHGASNILWEVCNQRCDNETARCNEALRVAGYSMRVPEVYSSQRAVTNLLYFMETFGCVLEGTDNELPLVDKQTSRNRFVYKVRDMIQDGYVEGEEENNYEDVEDVESLMESLFD